MKKTLALAILGVATVTTAFGQGHVLISSYFVAPYNQVSWGPGSPNAGQAVRTASVQLQVWYGAGSVADANLLQPGVLFNINPTLGNTFDPGAGKGAGGYYDPVIQVASNIGLTTYQLRAIPNAAFPNIDPVGSRSALFTADSVSTSLPAPTVGAVPPLVVVIPEPSTFALAGLGAAALLIFRRRA
jgi:hypothetical protein